MKRRTLLKGVPLILGGPQLWSQSACAGSSGHDDYFNRLNAMLKSQGPGRPVMLIDRAKMNHNIDLLANSVGPGKNYRVVVKSLPSIPMLKHIMQRAKTSSVMVFHQPFLNAIAASLPNVDVLLGKPMPVSAARTFYKNLSNDNKGRFKPETQLQWLIDTPERLQQYYSLARELDIKMQVNFEVDIGLRRGGFAHPDLLRAVLQTAKIQSDCFRISGLMGYDGHLFGTNAVSLDNTAVHKTLRSYRAFAEVIRELTPAGESLTLNGAGSTTLRLYENDNIINDLSAGSGIVMPSYFDTYHLAHNKPAVFIATPILKRYSGDSSAIKPDSVTNQNLYYIYGGGWRAQVVSPPDGVTSPTGSTNQSSVQAPGGIDLQVDDYIFLRPTQSESVMLQFGDLLVIDRGNIASRWPVFQQRA